MPLPSAHSDLHRAYPPQLLSCILACVVATEQRLGAAAPLFWEIAPSMDRLLGRALMAEDDLPPDVVPDHHHGWIRPTISYELPPVLAEGVIPAHLMTLVFHDDVLVSRQLNDAKMALLDVLDELDIPPAPYDGASV